MGEMENGGQREGQGRGGGIRRRARDGSESGRDLKMQEREKYGEGEGVALEGAVGDPGGLLVEVRQVSLDLGQGGLVDRADRHRGGGHDLLRV